MLEFEFMDNSLLGEKGEILGGFNPQLLSNIAGLNREEIKSQIWLESNMQHQTILKKLGY
jgi:hypothetical protein